MPENYYFNNRRKEVVEILIQQETNNSQGDKFVKEKTDFFKAVYNDSYFLCAQL